MKDAEQGSGIRNSGTDAGAGELCWERWPGPAAKLPGERRRRLHWPRRRWRMRIPAFLNSADGRLIRIVARSILEPLARFRREQIQDTVVFFGSARFRGREEADHALELLENTGSTQARAQRRAAGQASPRLPRARPPICSASAPWRRWRWPATTRMRGGLARC